MRVILSVTEGPFAGRQFSFEGHDTFLVGRVKEAQLQLPYDDPYFSRRHFVFVHDAQHERQQQLARHDANRVLVHRRLRFAFLAPGLLSGHVRRSAHDRAVAGQLRRGKARAASRRPPCPDGRRRLA